jgi:hypothetical protein
MKQSMKISERDIQRFFKKIFQLKIASSTISGFREQLKREAFPIYEQLRAALLKSAFIHADETGWRVDGNNYWLWKFSNKRICISHIDKNRGRKVVEKILGEDYAGVLIADFLAAYNKVISKAKQRCLVHLLRDLKKVIAYWHEDEEVLRYCKRLKEILEKAITLHKAYAEKNWDTEYYQQRQSLVQQLDDFIFPNPDKKVLCRFAKRLTRHKDQLLTFLFVRGIDFHNNHIEQQIRPDVIFRKITFGNRSEKGAENHSVLMSVLQTAQLHDLDPLETLQAILLPAQKNPFSLFLAPP